MKQFAKNKGIKIPAKITRAANIRAFINLAKKMERLSIAKPKSKSKQWSIVNPKSKSKSKSKPPSPGWYTMNRHLGMKGFPLQHFQFSRGKWRDKTLEEMKQQAKTKYGIAIPSNVNHHGNGMNYFVVKELIKKGQWTLPEPKPKPKPKRKMAKSKGLPEQKM